MRPRPSRSTTSETTPPATCGTTSGRLRLWRAARCVSARASSAHSATPPHRHTATLLARPCVRSLSAQAREAFKKGLHQLEMLKRQASISAMFPMGRHVMDEDDAQPVITIKERAGSRFDERGPKI